MIVEIGTVAVQFLSWEYLFPIFGTWFFSVQLQSSLSLRDRLLFYPFLQSLVKHTPLLVYSALTLFKTGGSTEQTEWQWATLWHTFHHDGKFFTKAGEGRAVNAHPLSLYLPSRTKQWSTLQLRYTPPISTLQLYVLCGRKLQCDSCFALLYMVKSSYDYCKSQVPCVQIIHGLNVASLERSHSASKVPVACYTIPVGLKKKIVLQQF